MFDVITFGSATWDISINSEDSKILRNTKFITNKGICYDLGSKISIEKIQFFSGGGGTNTAATFANQGFKTAYCGSIGADNSGKEVIDRLKKIGINISLISMTKKEPTNHSIILNSGFGGERTILVYLGASELLKNIKWNKIKTKWLYLAPMSGKLASFTKDIVNFAKVNDIKIAFNPSIFQLDLDNIEDIIEKVDVLILNQEEASILTKVPFKKELKIFKEIDEMCPGIAIMTKGIEGVVISDGVSLYSAKPDKIKVVDRTGAGDSFGSGFISGLIKYDDIEKAIQLGMANANSCLRKRGAKNGLLKRGAKFKNVKIKKKRL